MPFCGKIVSKERRSFLDRMMQSFFCHLAADRYLVKKDAICFLLEIKENIFPVSSLESIVAKGCSRCTLHSKDYYRGMPLRSSRFPRQYTRPARDIIVL